MSSKVPKYGIFINNALLNNSKNRNQQRTALQGQIIKIEDILDDGRIIVRFITENNGYEPTTFLCHQESIIIVNEKIWQYLDAVSSPQERIKIASNKDLVDKLAKISKHDIVGFKDTNSVILGKVKYMGTVKGIGYCFGIELHEKKKNNQCNGYYAGCQYFNCLPGYGVFTTIDKVVPNICDNPSQVPSSKISDLDICFHNLSGLESGRSKEDDGKPQYEELVTKYGEYSSSKLGSISKTSNIRSSLSLQNIYDAVDSVNTNNDFDQNTIIQNEKAYLVNNSKHENKSEVDLIDVIGGSWAGSTNSKELEQYSNLKKALDKNDIRSKYTTNVPARTTPRSKTILETNTTLRKSKFYTSDIIDNVNKSKPLDKEKGSKKINEKLEQQQSPRSTFYVNEKISYQDPLPGTTNDLSVGTLVEVSNDVSEEPLYGVIRWMGVETGSNFTLVGVELDDDFSHLPLTLTNGVHNGERLFKCSEHRAIFVPIQQCHKDSRFHDGTPTPLHQPSDKKQTDCPVIPGTVPPLCMPTEEDVEAVCGKYRGIQGHHNSCYLDVTLFAMFTYTAVFDSLLYRPKNPEDIADYEEVQRVLREEIVNPLRKNLFVSADRVMKLRELLDRLSSVSGLTSEEKDPEEFLNSLLAQILKAEPYLKLNSGQEAFHYQLFVEKDDTLTLPSVQQLFEQSFHASDIKLKEVPSCLIVQMPRFGKNYKVYPRILPSQLLDVTDIIEGSPRQCTICGKLAKWECRECFDDCSSGLESTAFCKDCLRTAHRHERRQHHRPTILEVAKDFSIMEEHCRPPRLFMELFAVICIETSHYVTFVKCGVGHEAPWCFFDSMADRRGEKNGYNIPEMVACPDVSQWLSDEGICRSLHEEFESDRHLPEHARRLLCDAYICMYQSSDVMMYR